MESLTCGKLIVMEVCHSDIKDALLIIVTCFCRLWICHDTFLGYFIK